MRYLKLIIAILLALVIFVAVVWFGIIILLISVVLAPFAVWLARRRRGTKETFSETSVKKEGTDSSSSSAASYKVIEAEYEIIEK